MCREGQLSSEVFFVQSGALDIIKAQPDGPGIRLAKLRAGAVAGELAFCTGEPRTASIIAVEASRVDVLHRASLDQMRAAHPALATRFDQMLITKISQALGRASKLIATLR